MSVVSLLVSLTVSAAPVTNLPYFCSFEEAAENSQWELNLPSYSGVANQWVVSSAQAYHGSNSLVLSGNGVDALYWSYYVDPNDLSITASGANSLTYAAREFDLPAGTYDLSFSWAAGGAGMNGGFDFMAVCWTPATSAIASQVLPDPDPYTGAPPASNLPQWVLDDFLTLNGTQKLFQSRLYWIEDTVQIVSTGQPMKLVFVWQNNDLLANQPSAMVDNIRISDCTAPTDFSVVDNGDGSATLNWTSAASNFDIEYGVAGQPNPTVVNNVSGSSYTIQNLTSDTYKFAIRTNCGSGKVSRWLHDHVIMNYVTDAGCVDYLDLESAYCVYGQYKPNCADDNGDGVCDFAWIEQGVVDNGSSSRMSRHTIHYPGETDPRTLDMLKTVPDGEKASVRLGNWSNMGETEAIEYTMDVPANSNIILTLKYAVIFEAPGHGPILDPGFNMIITDEAGNPLGDCTTADFFGDASLAGSNGWTLNTEYEGVLWKDWTTVGFSLQPYAGQRIKIQLTTMDCLMYKHFAYAYFTLGCSEARVSGLACGKNTSSTISAPDGFTYNWYNVKTPGTTVSTNKDLTIDPTDTATYHCKVSYIENPACYFTLEASLKERLPKADFAFSIDPVDCKKVTFTNNSAVLLGGHETSEGCETYDWDFGNGITSDVENPEIEFADGGTYTVKLIAGLQDKLCTDTTEVTISIGGDLQASLNSSEITLCADDDSGVDIMYTTPGSPVKYSLTFEDNTCFNNVVDQAIVAGTYPKVAPKALTVDTAGNLVYTKPGVYNAVLRLEDGCGDVELPLKVNVQYPKAVIAQRWNDVLALKNDKYNGSYKFSAYQWYKNGQPIEGETSSILYNNGTPFETSAVYQLLLTRESDGVQIFTCGIMPKNYTGDLSLDDITFDQVTSVLTTTQSGVARVYNATGVLLNTFNFEAGETEVNLPEEVGVYVLNITLADGVVLNDKIVVR